jgi:hypothetical protein
MAILYYAAFKLLGKGIKANYDGIKTALYPLFLALIIMNTFVSLIIWILPLTSTVLQNVASFWFYTIIFFLSRYKLRQTIARSVLISLIPLFVGVAFVLVSIVTRL